MADLTPSVAEGQTIIEAGGPSRAHNDSGDPMASGSYSHNSKVLSATEFNELASCIRYLQEVRAYLPLEHHVEDDTLTAIESGSVHTNSGSGTEIVTLTLPAPVAGLNYRFMCLDSAGIKINAQTGDVIYAESGTDFGGGTSVESVEVVSTIYLMAVSDSEWVMLSVTGAWSVT